MRAKLFPIALLLAGCSSMDNTEKGAGIGGLLGAGTGALIGNATGHAGAGALIGAGAGALGGALIGNQADKAEKKATDAQLAAATAAAQQGPLGLTDVAQLAQQHVSDELIINQIRSTNSIFRLSPTDITWLKANGVSDAVIFEMQSSANRAPRSVYTAAPVYRERVYVYDPYPPPVGVGVGFGYTRYRRW